MLDESSRICDIMHLLKLDHSEINGITCQISPQSSYSHVLIDFFTTPIPTDHCLQSTMSYLGVIDNTIEYTSQSQWRYFAVLKALELTLSQSLQIRKNNQSGLDEYQNLLLDDLIQEEVFQNVQRKCKEICQDLYQKEGMKELSQEIDQLHVDQQQLQQLSQQPDKVFKKMIQKVQRAKIEELQKILQQEKLKTQQLYEEEQQAIEDFQQLQQRYKQVM
eukprot:TRINITY_DN1971_c0_g1_i2.p1 TRINITY_DN1971_c0_g1~~TRINITY_DN1971_c0_g1_i2.p1  ORF type:complete len:219 (+),score=18.95 TRINITY_DN1971_c0_g1_i2:39-695(+)